MSRRRFLVLSAGAAALAAAPSLTATPAGARSTDRMRVNAGGLRLRTGPGTGYGVIASLAAGTIVRVLDWAGRANGYDWAKVEVESTGKVGYVAAAYLSPLGTGGDWATGSMVHVQTASGGGANLRTSASTSAGVIAIIRNGTTGTIVAGPSSGSGYTWYKVNFGDVEGWMATAVMSPGGGSDRAWVRVADGPLRVRSKPGLSGAVITTVPTGARGYTTTSMPQDADGYVWVNVQFDSGVRGWVAKNFLAWL
jgi:uncharacterized protein YgiM (DUF1202 family)